MGKIFKFLFIYILFFNTMFFGISDSMASSLKDNTVGPRDRIRSFVNNEIDFKYSRNDGFSCIPAGLKFYPNRDEYKSTNEYDKSVSNGISSIKQTLKKMGQDLSNSGQDMAAYLESMFFDIFLQPVFCITFLEGLLDSGSFGSSEDEEDSDGDEDTSGASGLLGNMTAVLKIILSVVGVNSMKYLAEMILSEDDYNIDPTNPYCMGYYVTEIVACLISLVVWRLDISFAKKIIVILSVNTAYYIAKMISSAVIFDRAQQVFKQLSLCGDNWNVYGDLGLQETLEEEISKGSATDIKTIGLSYLKKYYPSKGAFLGSYQYTLDQCFLKREKEVCRKLFNLSDDIEITNSTIDNNSNVIQKAYREFKYGGVEFAFNVDNNDCIDPRPERAGYLGTTDSTSQLYYFRGNEPANFACDRFLVKSDDAHKKAYRCCLEASQKLICIVNKEVTSNKELTMHTMCNKNSTCSVKSEIKFDGDPSYKSISCSDIKKSLDNAELSAELVESSYSNFCDEDGNLKPIYGYEYNVEDDGSGTKAAGASRIEFKIRQSIYDENKYCVETYNLCPYNFRILGGSEEFGKEFTLTHEENVPVKKNDDGIYEQKTLSKKVKKENEDLYCSFTKDGAKDCYGACHSTTTGAKGAVENVYDSCFNRASNFCQMDRHCVTITPLFEREKPDTSPYVDEACINLVGSSHNYDNYAVITDRPQHSFFLTAPLVECVVETAKNILMNKAGHTKCRDSNEIPANGSCQNTGEIYKKGKTLDESQYPSSFQRLRKYFLNITRLLMVLAVVLYGYSYLFQQKGFSSGQEIMKFLLKLMIVSYFATTTGWINPIFSGVYSVYGEVAELAVKLIGDEPDYNSAKYSGCYFIKSKSIDNNYEEYGDRSYISLFDTLDCKLSRYFGFYVNAATNPPILSLIIAGVFTFGVAIILILPLLLMFVGLLYFTASVALSFMVSSFTITLLLLVTPIMIPQLLFERTKDNVMKWLRAIVRNIFSPLFLVMGMFIFFTIFDKYFIGDAVFNGKTEPIRNIYCGKICKISDEQFSYISLLDYNEENNCKVNLRGKVINLSTKSLICVIQNATKQSTNSGISIINFIINDFKGLPGLFLEFRAFFDCFLDIMFLLIVIFIFNQFIPYIDSLTNTIFSGEAGVDDKLSMSLKEVMQSVAEKGAKFANKTKDYGGGLAINTAINKINEYRDRKIMDRKGGGEEEDEKGGSVEIGTSGAGANDNGGSGGGNSGDSGGDSKNDGK